MTRSRWSAGLLACTVMLALVGVGGARAETGGSVSEFGWWSKVPGAATQAGGGFQVADGPGGPLSVAAIRMNVTASTLTSARLVLPEVQQVGTAILQVCRTASSWTAASPGQYDSAPKPDCTSAIPMARDGAAVAWTADILPLLNSGPGQVSVMIVPGPPAAPLPAPAPFQVSFSDANLESEGSSEAPVAPSTSDSSGGFAETFGAGSSVGSPADFGVPAPLAEPVTAAPAPNEQVLTAPAQTPGRFPQRGDVGAPSGGADQPWGRLPLLMVVAAAIGAAASVARTQLRARGLIAA